MKKPLFYLSAIALTISVASCGGGGDHTNNKAQESTEANASESMEASEFVIDPAATTVRWEGGTAGAMVYSHAGTISLQNGMFVMDEPSMSLSDGSFIIDMASISPFDEGFSEEHPVTDFKAHLASVDFFDVENNPTASFEITSVDGSRVTGNLTVRGKTNEETMDVQFKGINDQGQAMGQGSLTFDRQKYDVAWAHYMQDVILSDDINLIFEFVANKK